MAICGMRISKETNDKNTYIHSLDNVVSFSKYLRQESNPNKEGVLTMSDICEKKANHIVKMCFPGWKPDELDKRSYSISLVASNLNRPQHGINIKTVKYLTLARNLVHFSFHSKRFVPNKDKYNIYKERHGADRSLVKMVGDHNNVYIHPKYNGYPDCGFDIGILPFMENVGRRSSSKSVDNGAGVDTTGWHDVLLFDGKVDSIEKGMTVEVAGYPSKRGSSQESDNGKIIDVRRTKQGGYLLWYKASIKPVQPGSCIMITDSNFIKQYANTSGAEKVIVGLHSGYDAVAELNYGTMITPNIIEWMRKSRRKEASTADACCLQ